MRKPDPTQKIPPDIPALVRALARHRVTWLLAGSYVLTLHGADIDPNDLDVVVQRNPDNLARLASCLSEIGAVPFWSGDAKWDLGTPSDHLAWRPKPATLEHLDQLFVTRHGMLDIPFALVPDYGTLIGGASRRKVADHWIDVCDPRSVLVALEKRRRKKDLQRQPIYNALKESSDYPRSIGKIDTGPDGCPGAACMPLEMSRRELRSFLRHRCSTPALLQHLSAASACNSYAALDNFVLHLNHLLLPGFFEINAIGDAGAPSQRRNAMKTGLAMMFRRHATQTKMLRAGECIAANHLAITMSARKPPIASDSPNRKTPPCARAISVAIARPKPTPPPLSWFRAGSSRLKGRVASLRRSSGMPGPLSSTR